MKKEFIKELFEKFEHVRYLVKEIECWSARELQSIYRNSEWRNFLKVIDKAKKACENAGEKITDHFVDVNKMVEIGSDTKREIKDIALTSHNVVEKGLRGKESISVEHVQNNLVRKIFLEREVKPESLPPSEDVKKVQRKLEGEEKKILKEVNEKKKNSHSK